MVVEAEFEGNNSQARGASNLRRFFRVLFSRWLVIFGVVVIFVAVMTPILASVLAPYDPYEQDLSQSLQKPSGQHLLGTDSLGRDTLSRLIYGSRNSMLVGVVALSIAATIGIAMGLFAGYFGGWRDHLLMRVMDALFAFPTITLAPIGLSPLANRLR